MTEPDINAANDPDPVIHNSGSVTAGDRPAWVLKLQYTLATFLLVCWVTFLALDAVIPDYEGIPFVAHVIIGAVALFTFPGSEKLLGGFFKRG
jgi:hypothetical protein